MTERTRGVYAISVAAEMVSMEIQNLRVYERRGLVDPDRSAGGTRRYSPDDIERLHRIRELLAEGLNLAGISRVLALEEEIRRLREANAELRGARPAARSRGRPVN
ncbi:MAG: MerR family transcriptional regulator [Actinomycetota bacterium]|nr:MerR family transcriptional regulator [Actinomycetota bacterium]